MQELKVSYDPKGFEEEYGIQFHGDLEFLLKAITMLVGDVTLPLTSHHGTWIRLKDYDLTLRLAERQSYIQLILERDEWRTVIRPDGNSSRKEIGMTTDEKKGFMVMVEKCMGVGIRDVWNHDNTGDSVSIVMDMQADFSSEDEAHKEFVEQLKKLVMIKNTL